MARILQEEVWHYRGNILPIQCATYCPYFQFLLGPLPTLRKPCSWTDRKSASGLRTVKSQPRRRGAEATKARRQHRTPSAPRGTHARAAENEKGSGGPPEDAEQGLKGSRLTGARARAAGLKGAQVPGRSGADLRGPFDREARPRL